MRIYIELGIYLTKRLSVLDSDLCVGCASCMLACTRRFAEVGYGKSAIHVRSAGGMEKGFIVVVCRACLEPPCAKVCPEDALVPRKGGGIILKPEKCIACGYCVEACPFGAIFWDEEVNKPIICVYGGYCANYCPYNVIALEEVR